MNDRAVSVQAETTAVSGDAKPKVVRILGRLNVGGAARQVCLLHERLADGFETLLVIGRTAAGEEGMDHLLHSERNVVRIPEMSRRVSPLADAVAFWKILRLLRRVRPDIVHTHSAKGGALGRLAAAVARVPIVIHTYHGHVFHSYFGPLKTAAVIAVERLLGRLTTRVIAISPAQRRDIALTYRIVPERKTVVIRNGFPLAAIAASDRAAARAALGLAPEEFVVAWVARMVPVKDVALLGEVIRGAARAGLAIRFLVVGDGSERPALERAVHGLANVKMLGWWRDMAQIWAAADAALLTSLNEGTPTALVEAMAAGRPFVATDVGAVRDLALPPFEALPRDMGQRAANGFLVARAPAALLHGLAVVKDDPVTARAMGKRGQEYVLAEYSLERLAGDMHALYRELRDPTAKL